MKKVLVPLAVGKLSTSDSVQIHIARDTYIKKLVKYNLMPVFVSTEMNEEMIELAYLECNGILIMGGADYHPEMYDEDKHPETMPVDIRLDRLEQVLIKKSFQDKKPIIGICRGHQAIAIASGAKLIQHIPDLKIAEEHRASGGSYESLYTDQKHEVIVDSNSKIFKIIAQTSVMTNTGHHQCVDRLDENSGFRIVGRSRGGIAEIIESTDLNYFCFGVQSHPEAEEDSFFEKLFEKFANVI